MWKIIALRNRSGKLSVQLEIRTFLVLTVHMPRGYQDARRFRINVLITLAVFIFIFSDSSGYYKHQYPVKIPTSRNPAENGGGEQHCEVTVLSLGIQ